MTELEKLKEKRKNYPYALTQLETVILLASEWVTAGVVESAAQELVELNGEVKRKMAVVHQAEVVISTEQKILIFDKVCGTVEEYGSDKKMWMEDFGVFCIGWNSCVEMSAQLSKVDNEDKKIL